MTLPSVTLPPAFFARYAPEALQEGPLPDRESGDDGDVSEAPVTDAEGTEDEQDPTFSAPLPVGYGMCPGNGYAICLGTAHYVPLCSLPSSLSTT